MENIKSVKKSEIARLALDKFLWNGLSEGVPSEEVEYICLAIKSSAASIFNIRYKRASELLVVEQMHQDVKNKMDDIANSYGISFDYNFAANELYSKIHEPEGYELVNRFPEIQKFRKELLTELIEFYVSRDI